MSREMDDRNLGTADLVAATEAPSTDVQRDEMRSDSTTAQPEQRSDATITQVETRPEGAQAEPLAALFDPDIAANFHTRWSEVQIGFVDDPRQAVKKADELVAQVMTSLAESFAQQRASIEADVNTGDKASTENLRVALRRYRSFFERLLKL
ncbi:MAG TPA: hypothetical protein VLJ58_00935 [Ramlibacter sp.]|nr:hypothetical protein [Ramlibacter sp.]